MLKGLSSASICESTPSINCLGASGSHRERLARLSAKIGEIRVRDRPT